MSSRSISLAALSCVLLVSGTGCSQISNMVSQKATESLDGALTEAIEEAQAATTIAPVAEAEPQALSQANYVAAAKEASSRAQANAETAVTRAEWIQVDGDWQQAINTLEAVSEDSAEYAEARTLLASYKNSQAAAAKNYLAADQARYTTLTSSPINDAPKTGTFEADARQLRKWLHKGEFSKVDTLLRSAMNSDRRTSNGTMYADAVLVNALNGPGVVYMPELMKQLNKWVEAEPRNAMAYVVRSYFNQVPVTWTQLRMVREGSRDTNPDASAQQLVVSLLDSEVALELESSNRMALIAQLRMAKIVSLWGEEEGDETFFSETFEKANAAMPNSFEVAQEKAQYLFIKDRSGDLALEYLRPLAASAGSSSAVPMLIPMVHFYIGADIEALGEHLQKPGIWPEVQKNAEKAIAGLPDSALFPAWYARMATLTNNNAIASKHIQIAMNNGSESPLVQSFLRMMQ